jgi:tartrate dehydratase alpha subunit/fumarate hydratase class I-like protein
MKLFNWFRKEKVIVEVTGIYIKQGKISKELQNKIDEQDKLKALIGDNYQVAEEDEIEIPLEQDTGIIQFHLEELYMISEAESKENSVIMLYSGVQFLCNYSTVKFKAYLKTKGYKVDELS